MPVAIRFARPSDRRRLIRLVAAYYAFDSIPYVEGAVSSALSRLLRDRSLGRVWVIDNGRALIAYAILAYSFDLEFGGREGIITDLFIAAPFRHKGYGRQLLSIIGRYCKRAAIHEIEVVVTRKNRAALGFYKSSGFHDRQRSVLTLELKQA